MGDPRSSRFTHPKTEFSAQSPAHEARIADYIFTIDHPHIRRDKSEAAMAENEAQVEKCE